MQEENFKEKSKDYKFYVDGKSFNTHDPVKSGREILQVAGMNPASDYALILITRPGSTSIGLEDEIDFREAGREEFRTFASDRVFRFTLNERGCEWGASTISEEELRDLAGTHPDRLLLLEREDVPDEIIEPGTSVDLAANGVEHIREGKKFVTVYYKEQAFELKPGVYTGAQLMERLKVPAGYVLQLVIPGGLDDLGSDKRLKIRDGMHFISHAPCGQSS